MADNDYEDDIVEYAPCVNNKGKRSANSWTKKKPEKQIEPEESYSDDRDEKEPEEIWDPDNMQDFGLARIYRDRMRYCIQ